MAPQPGPRPPHPCKAQVDIGGGGAPGLQSTQKSVLPTQHNTEMGLTWCVCLHPLGTYFPFT